MRVNLHPSTYRREKFHQNRSTLFFFKNEIFESKIGFHSSLDLGVAVRRRFDQWAKKNNRSKSRVVPSLVKTSISNLLQKFRPIVKWGINYPQHRGLLYLGRKSITELVYIYNTPCDYQTRRQRSDLRSG